MNSTRVSWSARALLLLLSISFVAGAADAWDKKWTEGQVW